APSKRRETEHRGRAKREAHQPYAAEFARALEDFVEHDAGLPLQGGVRDEEAAADEPLAYGDAAEDDEEGCRADGIPRELPERANQIAGRRAPPSSCHDRDHDERADNRPG